MTPREVITNPIISDEMEKYLGKDEKINTRQTLLKSHPKKPKFKMGDTVRYLKRRSKFSKEASLTGNWSDKLYKIQSINSAHSFKPMHTYMLSELGTNKPVNDLPPI